MVELVLTRYFVCKIPRLCWDYKIHMACTNDESSGKAKLPSTFTL